MSDSLDAIPVHQITDFMAHPDLGRGERRVVWFRSKQHDGPVDVLISWEGQCAVARSSTLTTDEIFERHAADFDRQVALLMLRGPQPKSGWALDAGDIVTIS